MSEELIQRNLIDSPEKMGDWNFYNIGATTLKALKSAKLIPDKDYETFESKKPDALIVKKPVVIAAIEYKTPSQLRTEKANREGNCARIRYGTSFAGKSLYYY